MIYLSAVVVSDPKITVGIDRHAVRHTGYVVRLEIVERFAVRCWAIELIALNNRHCIWKINKK